MRRFMVGLCCAVVATGVPAGLAVGAWASPTHSGVSATELGKGTSAGTVKVKNSDETDVVMRHIVLEPGGSTGWHYHPGDLIAVVHKGTLTRVFLDCSAQTNPAGEAFVEYGGQQNTHVGRNLGTEPVELYVTYVIPAGAPLAIEADDPGC